MTIYYKKDKHTEKIPVKLYPHRFGSSGYVIIQAPTRGLYVPLVGNIAELIVELRTVLEQLEAMVCTEQERGLLRAEVKSLHFNRITIDDIKEALLVEEKLALLIERFSNSPERSKEIASLVVALKADYRKYASHSYEKRAEPISAEGDKSYNQLEADLAKIAPYCAEIIGPDGQPIYGAQSKVAEVLGVANAGNYRRRIIAVIKALTAKTTNSNALTASVDTGIDDIVA